MLRLTRIRYDVSLYDEFLMTLYIASQESDMTCHCMVTCIESDVNLAW